MNETTATTLPVGRKVVATVPATSANLGSGFDSLGMALEWADDTAVEVVESEFCAHVSGEGADFLPRDESHLVVRVILDALKEWNVRVPGLRLEAHNTIPIGKGLGSSSAAIVAGLAAAWGLANPARELDLNWLLARSAAIEGHADNVGPAVFGHFALTWMEAATTPTPPGSPGVLSEAVQESDELSSPPVSTLMPAVLTARAVALPVHSLIRAMVFIPQRELKTEQARQALPELVPFEDAKANLSAAALLVHALQYDPGLLLAATADRLHQGYRRDLYPESFALMSALREAGFAACISGAGPTVLALVAEAQVDALEAALASAPLLERVAGFRQRLLSPGAGARIEVLAR